MHNIHTHTPRSSPSSHLKHTQEHHVKDMITHFWTVHCQASFQGATRVQTHSHAKTTTVDLTVPFRFSFHQLHKTPTLALHSHHIGAEALTSAAIPRCVHKDMVAPYRRCRLHLAAHPQITRVDSRAQARISCALAHNHLIHRWWRATRSNASRASCKAYGT